MPAKKRKQIIRYAIVVVVIALIVGYVQFKRGAVDEPIIRTAKVERGTVTASVSATGTLQPLTTVEVKSNVGGQVVKLAVDEGDEVTPGQLIAKIDPSDSVTTFEQSQADLAAALSKVDQAKQQLTMQHLQNAAQIESARQALAAAKTRLLQAEEQARVQPSLTQAAVKQAINNYQAAEAAARQAKAATIPQKLAAAQAAFDQAKASQASSEKEYARQKQLLDKGYVSKSQFDTAEEKYNVNKAQLDTAKRKLDTIKEETAEDLASAQAKLEQARAALEDAQANQVQIKLKKQEAESARAAVKQAEAALQVALAATHEDIIRKGDVVQADAQVRRSQAAYNNARTQLGYTTIVAPRAGIVTKKYVEAGSIVTAGRSSVAGTGSGVAIVDIADTSRMFVLVDVDETDIAQVEIGQEVDVSVEAYPDELFTGKVTKIAPQSVTDQNVTTIPVTVEIDMPDARLKPGMNANCDFITGRAENVLRVPSEAVKEDDKGDVVTVMKDGKQVERKVEIGIAGSDYTEIKKGLKPGENVVTAVITLTNADGSMGGGQTRNSGMGGSRGMRMRF
jgi:HlyD family secretion protein